MTNPEWALPGAADEWGNVACRVCKKIQSPSFKACVYCCPHHVLDRAHEDYWKDICKTCGKDFFEEPGLKEYSLVKDSYLHDLKDCLTKTIEDELDPYWSGEFIARVIKLLDED